MRSLQVWVVALILAGLGIFVMLYKHFTLEFPLTPDTTYKSWYVEARVDLASKNPWRQGDKPVMFNLQLPHHSERFVLVDENIVARGFGYEIIETDEEGNRAAVFSKRKMDAEETIFYRAIVYELDSPTVQNESLPAVPDSPYSKKNRPKLEEGEKQNPVYLAVDALIAEARDKSASPRTFVREISKLTRDRTDDRIQLIRDTVNRELTDVAIAALLLEADGIPTRIAHGLKLTEDQRRATTTQWLEVFIKGNWVGIDPAQQAFGLKDKYIVWWYGDRPLYTIEGNARADTMIAVRQNTNNALTRAIWKSGQLADIFLTFSFYNLPLDAQLVFNVLLMLPVGGLVLAFLRQVIGLKTFGTFMPVLVALAFRETGLFAGLMLFTLVVALGLFIRNYFDHLKLLLVPRLASVLTVVVIVLSLLAMLTNQMGLVVGLSISLFPIVVLTMTIERMTLLWEEYGSDEALKTGLSSMFCAVIAYFAMNNATINYLIFAFPELLLVVLALSMLLGRYNYYKLTEYIRFRQLQRSLAELEKKEKGGT
ncbi:MAG: UUP1 family membrane protein [Alphaproteobacteria bacterium]